MALRMKILFLALIVLFFVPASTMGSEKSLILYILDGSGSMWGRVDGKFKIQVAKEVMTTLLKETPADIECGVMVYGHRKKGDCADIEMLIPIGALDREAAIPKINGISPKGKTPISDSIALAVNKIRGNEGAATLVLVSDGLETCGKDPCEVVKKIKESGIHFVMHVVGFDVKTKAAEQLACIAQAGGGQYFNTTQRHGSPGGAKTRSKKAWWKRRKLHPRRPRPSRNPSNRPSARKPHPSE